MRNCILGLCVMALIVSSIGCAKTTEDVHPVSGKITYDGKPLAGARIRLEAVAGGVSRVYACDSKDDGSYDIEAAFSTGTLKGAPLGKYRVLVGKFKKEKAPETSDPDDTTAAELELLEQQTEGGPDLVEQAAPKTSLNPKFNISSSTPLTLEVKDGDNKYNLELKGDGTGSVTAIK